MAASPGPKGAAPEAAAESAARALGIEGLRVFMVSGVPHIEGTVPSFQHKRAAAELIGLSTGADHVVNLLRVAPREAHSDRAVARRVRAALERTPEVDTATIQLDIRDGVAQLRGMVSSLSARCSAEWAVWSVGGVTNVVNDLRAAGIGTSCDDLACQLEADLCACLDLPAAAVTVSVQGHTVRLEGTVPSPHHRLAAEDLVRAHEMVQDVQNALAVTETLEAAPNLPTGERTQTRAS